jgi:hypothetical protein
MPACEVHASHPYWWQLVTSSCTPHPPPPVQQRCQQFCCSTIAEAESAVPVNGKKWLAMHMHVQLKLD